MTRPLLVFLFVTMLNVTPCLTLTRQEIIELHKAIFDEFSKISKEPERHGLSSSRDGQIKVDLRTIEVISHVLPSNIARMIPVDRQEEFIKILFQFCPGQPYEINEANVKMLDRTLECISSIFYWAPEACQEPFFFNITFLHSIKELFFLQQCTQDYFKAPAERTDPSGIEKLLSSRSKKSIACSIQRLMLLMKKTFSLNRRDEHFMSQTVGFTAILKSIMQKVFSTTMDSETLLEFRKTLSTTEVVPEIEAESLLMALFEGCPQ